MRPEPISPGPAKDVPTSPAAWRIVAVVSIISFVIIGGTLTSLGVFLPRLQADFGLAPDGLGQIAFALLVSMSVTSLLAGWGVDRFGARLTVLCGVIVTASGWAAAGYGTTVPQIVAAMLLVGGGAGAATIVPGIALITRVHDRHRGLALAIFIGSCALASSAVPPLTGLVIAQLGWRAAFFIGSGAIIILCLPLIPLLGRRERVPAAGPAGAAVTPGLRACLTLALRKGDYWRLAVTLTLAQASLNAVLFSVITLLAAQGYEESTAISSYSVANLMGLPALLAGGLLADRFGGKPVLVAAMLMQAFGTFALLGTLRPDTYGVYGLAGFVVLWGFASGLPAQAGPMVLARIVGQQAFATVLGFNMFIVGLLGALAPLGMDWLYWFGDGYFLPILVFSLFTIVAAALVVAIKPERDNAGLNRPAAAHPVQTTPDGLRLHAQGASHDW
ncbi:MFS transporter [Croceicoccus sp. F390]|uniref:MFS transporter n=1 Tax=Croceicoccus esteveae TaxID=3075597 RepID=A0ABU2ZKG6_9SPHN|nr:MFS transporter [Croceicoccus sp. F390]MDT0577087.1 MFS transporter [Croceicoccus sp. F390]